MDENYNGKFGLEMVKLQCEFLHDKLYLYIPLGSLHPVSEQVQATPARSTNVELSARFNIALSNTTFVSKHLSSGKSAKSSFVRSIHKATLMSPWPWTP